VGEDFPFSAWPIIGKDKNQLFWNYAKLPMVVSGKSRYIRLANIMRRHFNSTAAKWGVGDNADDII
jgi:serine/threonine-protein kinase HipA